MLFGTPYIFLTISVMPVLEISRLICAMIKALNATSQAISVIGQELGQVKEAVLEYGTTIDYLLLRHSDGCEEFKGFYCFNLTDNSQLTEH